MWAHGALPPELGFAGLAQAVGRYVNVTYRKRVRDVAVT